MQLDRRDFLKAGIAGGGRSAGLRQFLTWVRRALQVGR